MAFESPKTVQRAVKAADVLIDLAEIATDKTLSLAKLLPALADLTRKFINYELLAVLLKEDGSDYLRVAFASGHGKQRLKNRSVRIGCGISGRAAARRTTIISNDVSKNAFYIKVVDDVRSEMAVPLLARRRLIGVIDFESTQPNAFGKYEEAVLHLIASRIAAAIENARLHRKTATEAERLRTLLSASQEFSTILELEPLVNRIFTLTRQLIRYDAFSIFLLETGADLLKHYLSVRYDERMHIENVPLSGGIVGAAARSRSPVLVRDTSKDPRYLATIPGIRSEVAIPLVLRDRVIGVLDLESEHLEFFTRDHVWTLSLLAPQLAAAIENARLYERLRRHEARLDSDLRAARQLQQSLLAAPATLPGLEVAARNEPAISVSGDFYDLFNSAGNRVDVFVGDVSGHGAAAALYGAMATGLLRQMVSSTRTPAELLEAVNQALCARKVDSRYVAAVCVQWRPEEHSFVVAASGVPRPILLRNEGVEYVNVEGLPLGLIAGTRYEECTLRVTPGDILVLASDGILDAMNAADEEYGYDRLAQAALANRSLTAAGVVEGIFVDVHHHAAGGEIEDDRTAVVLKVM